MKTEFILKEEHLMLLKEAYVSWFNCEYGAPAIDCKRPYGNSSVSQDICEILKNEYITEDECRKLHEETETALQIVLHFIGSEVKVGKYVKVEYGNEWKFIG